MPLNKYFKGHGEEVMANMQQEYGADKGEDVFYAKANKEHMTAKDAEGEEKPPRKPKAKRKPGFKGMMPTHSKEMMRREAGRKADEIAKTLTVADSGHRSTHSDAMKKRKGLKAFAHTRSKDGQFPI